jgi:pimeloyl-ACP methyl ester carboxylesterase
MQTIIFVLVAIALVYAGWLTVLFVNQRRMQYFPSHRDQAGKGDPVFKPWMAQSGKFLGYYRPVAKPSRAIVFFHGNAGEALDRAWLAELASDDDYLLFLPEYPGFGARPGAPSETAIFESAKEAVTEVAQRWGIPITVLGESLGTGPACLVAGNGIAAQTKIDRLALISPFTSATELAARAYRYVPVRLLHKDRMEAIKLISAAQVPLHIIHGTLDEVIPIDMGRELLKKYPFQTKAMTEVPGYGHGNINLAVVDSPFADEFRSFLRGE